jgi:hypothetical protein
MDYITLQRSLHALLQNAYFLLVSVSLVSLPTALVSLSRRSDLLPN